MIKYRLIIFRKSLFFTISKVDRSFFTADVMSNFYSNYLIQKKAFWKFFICKIFNFYVQKKNGKRMLHRANFEIKRLFNFLSLLLSHTYLPLSLSYQSPSEKVLRWALFYETESETWASLDILELMNFLYFLELFLIAFTVVCILVRIKPFSRFRRNHP